MKNEYVRHTLATIQYRLNKSLIHSDDQFGNFTPGQGSRSPIQILRHMHDVLNYGIKFTGDSNQASPIDESATLSQVHKIFSERVDVYDELLSKDELDSALVKKLLQGPLSDILTHVGQIAMLSRLNNKPIEGEDFSSAAIGIVR